MNEQFRALVNALDAKYQALCEMPPIVAADVPTNTPVGGVYLFSEHKRPLYAGRTKRSIGTRIKYHFCTANDCPFAWLIAREETGRKATYTRDGSRNMLLADEEFREVYEAAKARIRKMHVRYVNETNPLRQALLEVYVAVAANARYNDFDTH